MACIFCLSTCLNNSNLQTAFFKPSINDADACGFGVNIKKFPCRAQARQGNVYTRF